VSLRWRLMLSVAAVVLASLATVALISSRVVRVELNELRHSPTPITREMREGAAREIAAHYARHGLSRMPEQLARVRAARFPRSELLLLDPNRRLLASSAPIGEKVEVAEARDGATRIRFGGAASRSEIVVKGDPADVIVAGQGRIGSLLLTPRFNARPRDPMRIVNRWLLFAVAAVGLAALAFTALVARSIIAPIERLQQATARVRGGAPAEHVPVTSRDEVGRLAEAFNAMTARLERHEELRRNLVNDVAHELRTPLTNLRASIETIQDGLRAPDAKVIDALHDDVLILQRLVEDLQTLALAEAGKLPLHIERVDLAEELSRLGRIDPRVHVQVASGSFANVDRVRLQQVLSNLVVNALAHIAPDGRVEIEAIGSRITVTDDGPGIPPAALPHIFDRFYRADPSRTRTTGGAGLGLTIARELVEAQGGRVWVEEGEGARFVIDLSAGVPSAEAD
jgi:signal transduction histidine kinase